jgi:hypothetical protein
LPDLGKEEKETKDRLIQDYDTILKESALLTTFCGILFGFLLNISLSSSARFDFIDRVVLMIALFTISIAVSLFIMPVIYHHLQFPYSDLDKFKRRAHRFILFGIVPTAITLYLGMVLAFSPLMDKTAFVIAAIPFAFVYFLFKMRK